MTILIIGSVLIGTALGRFFKVWILVPVCMAAFIFILARSFSYGLGMGLAFCECAILGTGLQIGYASGLVFAFLPGLRQSLEETGESCPGTPAVATRQRRMY
ncbi:MAG TPA: hypothetical protein VL996_00965 [Methylocella sp.]|nr:hypothetical protein [Methylocella sp.]